jgi:hypothetical protein
MEAAVRRGGSRRLSTALAIAGAAALGAVACAAAGASGRALWAALPAFLLAALVGIARTTTA